MVTMFGVKPYHQENDYPEDEDTDYQAINYAKKFRPLPTTKRPYQPQVYPEVYTGYGRPGQHMVIEYPDIRRRIVPKRAKSYIYW